MPDSLGVTEESLTAAKIDQGFSAANGSPVRMLVEVQIEVEVLLEDHSGERSHRSAVMNVWVGETQHNILSTTMLCFRGWTFAQDRDGITLQAPGGAVAAEVTLYGNVPWLRLRPSKSSGVASSESLPLASVVVAPVTRSTEAELAQHRLQGHTPFHPGCRHCQVARSVHQHRKKSGGRIESEVIADFFYLTTTGEDLRSMNVDHLKVLVMVERMSNMIGAVAISSNVVQTRSAIVAWLKGVRAHIGGLFCSLGHRRRGCSCRFGWNGVWELLRSRSKEQSLRTTRQLAQQSVECGA